VAPGKGVTSSVAALARHKLLSDQLAHSDRGEPATKKVGPEARREQMAYEGAVTVVLVSQRER
jgi:hypothetical protein